VAAIGRSAPKVPVTRSERSRSGIGPVSWSAVAAPRTDPRTVSPDAPPAFSAARRPVPAGPLLETLR
jgi:hypothetical protein